MPWVKLTDDWYDDPKLAGANALEIAMWVVGVSWCARNLTDGYIPAGQVRKLVNLDEFTIDGQPVKAESIVAGLVATGAWQSTPNGYVVTNFLRYQPSRDQVLASRERDRLRKESQRRPNSVRVESGRNPNAPVPVPVTTSPSSSNSSTGNGSAPPVDDEKLWLLVADRQLSRQPAGSVRNPTAWLRRAARNAQIEFTERAAELRNTYDVPIDRLADCLADGGTVPTSWTYNRRNTDD